MDGKPLRYRLNADGTFLLYSVGEDGEDNGGDPAQASSSSGASKFWWKGRDAVWSTPATAQEVAADNEKLEVQRMKNEKRGRIPKEK